MSHVFESFDTFTDLLSSDGVPDELKEMILFNLDLFE